MPFPPMEYRDIFKTSYWRQLQNEIEVPDGKPRVADERRFWGDHPQPGEVGSWQALLPLLHELDAFLQAQEQGKEKELLIYKTKGNQDLQDIHDWHEAEFHLKLRKFVRQKTWKRGDVLMSNADIARHMEDGHLHSPLGGHVGHLAPIEAHLGQGEGSILRFHMRKGAMAALFRAESPLVFSGGARSIREVAAYFRYRDADAYEVSYKAGGQGEGYLAGRIGVKAEDDYVSFCIGANEKSKAVFSILVKRCEWERKPANAAALDRNYLAVW